MPSWKELLDELKAVGSTYDVFRRRYVEQLYQLTERNVIVYYSGWLQKPGLPFPFGINDADKNGFMAAIHKLDRGKGLDLILHTPGGDVAATEALVDYLCSMFGTNIRAVVPQVALSAGTLISLACKQIVMGKHSSLGPIDPQIGLTSAHGIIEEFQQAATEIKSDPAKVPVWQPILAKYGPALIGDCDKAIKWTNELAKEWLVSGMFDGHDDAESKAETVISELANHALTKSHTRHISAARAKTLGLEVLELEQDDDLQEAVLSVHHACIQTLNGTGACKIIENQLGVAFIQGGQAAVVQ